jgi:hypothetical protein
MTVWHEGWCGLGVLGVMTLASGGGGLQRIGHRMGHDHAGAQTQFEQPQTDHGPEKQTHQSIISAQPWLAQNSKKSPARLSPCGALFLAG